MFIDLADGDPPQEVTADICIAGSGAAGTTLALELKDRGLDVVILEGGGQDFEHDSQDMYDGAIAGRPYLPLDTVRLRTFGGSTQHWGGMSRPLDLMDFQERPWVPHSGWPISEADLLPHRARAHELLQLGPVEYDPAAVAPDDGLYFDLDPAKLVHRVYRISPPTRFADAYGPTLRTAEDVRVFFHANLIDIQLEQGLGATRAFVVRTPVGADVPVRAKVFVLALGGIENPRLLLNADKQMPAGVGNQNDLVGRFFMEHPNKDAGYMVTSREDAIRTAYKTFKAPGGGRVLHGIGLAPEIQRAQETLNLSITLYRARKPTHSEGYLAYQKFMKTFRQGRYGDLGDDLLAVLEDIGGFSRDYYSSLRGTLETEMRAYVRSEQAPIRRSRVRLQKEVDSVGLRRVALEWHFSGLEKHTFKVAMQVLGEEMGRLGFGRVRLADYLESEGPDIEVNVGGGAHHLGTTRMHDDPKQGVVDRHCKVHGNANLYIAGSSVFTAGGFANPTLTLVELAVRLAGHLSERLGASGA